MPIELNQPLDQILEQLQRRKVNNQRATITALKLQQALSSPEYPVDYPSDLTPTYNLAKAPDLESKGVVLLRALRVADRLEQITLPYYDIRRLQLNRALDAVKLRLDLNKRNPNPGIDNFIYHEVEEALQSLNKPLIISPAEKVDRTKTEPIQYDFEQALLQNGQILTGDEARLVYILQHTAQPLDTRSFCEKVLGNYNPHNNRHLHQLIDNVNSRLIGIQLEVCFTHQTKPGQPILYGLRPIPQPQTQSEQITEAEPTIEVSGPADLTELLEKIELQPEKIELETLTLLKHASPEIKALVMGVFENGDFEYAMNLLTDYLKDGRVDFFMTKLETGLFGWLIEETAYRQTQQWIKNRIGERSVLLSPHNVVEFYKLAYSEPEYETIVDEWSFNESIFNITIPDGLVIIPNGNQSLFVAACEYTAVDVANNQKKIQQMRNIKTFVPAEIHGIFTPDHPRFTPLAADLLCARHESLSHNFAVDNSKFQIFYTVLPGINVPGIGKKNICTLPYRPNELGPIVKAIITDGKVMVKNTGSINPKLFRAEIEG